MPFPRASNLPRRRVLPCASPVLWPGARCQACPLPWPRLAVARATMGGMRPDEFQGAENRRIQHRAGIADLDQSAEDFLFLYGLPNFFFHLAMGYAALRAAGVTLGKADFDGFHAYPPES